MDIRKTHVVLDPSEIPFDVTFVIEECGSEVKAHKFIMGMGSPMCMKQFYGALKEIEDTIVIKSTTKDAFVTMVNVFYGKKVDLAEKTIEELFDIANLAEKYQVEALKEEIEEAAKNFPLDEDNVVIVASIAEEFSQFQNLNNTIIRACRRFLLTVLKRPEDFFGFAEKYSGTELANVAFKLLAVKSCCELKTCRRGKPMLNLSDFKVGKMVKINPEAKDCDVTDAQRRNGVEGTIAWIARHESPLVFLKEPHWYSGGYNIEYENVATFLFCYC